MTTIMGSIGGGLGGSPWSTDDAKELLAIRIQHGSVIDAISFQYVSMGEIKWSPVRGGTGGKLSEIALEYGEYLTSITGHYGPHYTGPIVVKSLTFISNISTYGPYGTEEGTAFSLPAADAKIVSFYGRSGQFLDAIGVNLRTRNRTIIGLIEGGPGGSPWRTGAVTKLLAIRIQHGSVIDAISFQYDSTGETIWSSVMGGSGGKLSEINLEQGEFLTSITGHYGPHYTGHIVVTSLTFISNIHKYGPYGKEEGTAFSLPLTEAKILAFYGCSGTFLDAIGVNLMPIEGTIMGSIGGGPGGSPWSTDDATELLAIKIQHGSVIDAISFQYKSKGETKWSPVRGGTGGEVSEINLEEGEFLTSIMGHYGPEYATSPTVTRSLTFISNIRKYGPYGREEGTAFSIPVSKGKIVAFYGRSGQFLDAIGIYFVPESSLSSETPPWMPW